MSLMIETWRVWQPNEVLRVVSVGDETTRRKAYKEGWEYVPHGLLQSVLKLAEQAGRQVKRGTLTDTGNQIVFTEIT